MADAATTTAAGPSDDAVIRRWFPFTRPELPRLGAMYGFIALLHIAGWGLFLYYGHRYGVAFAAAGGLAYSFGLRHAFDADHIAAVDDTTRLLMQQGERPLGCGFFFSLGHSTVVITLALSLALATRAVAERMPALQRIGGTIGASVSGTFLLVIAVLDAVILYGIVQVWKRAKHGAYQPEELDELMSQRGFLNRIIGPRWRRFVAKSWHLYPIGLLFGLGFDTASEIGLLAITAGAVDGGHATVSHGVVASGSHVHALPFAAIASLPLLFAAGMTLMDTSDGVFMTRAYGWAFQHPLRKTYYNMTTVLLGVLVAGGVGLVEYLQILSDHVGFHGAFWDWLGGLDFEVLGYLIVGAFVVMWLGSMLLYRLRDYEGAYAAANDDAVCQ